MKPITIFIPKHFTERRKHHYKLDDYMLYMFLFTLGALAITIVHAVFVPVLNPRVEEAHTALAGTVQLVPERCPTNVRFIVLPIQQEEQEGE